MQALLDIPAPAAPTYAAMDPVNNVDPDGRSKKRVNVSCSPVATFKAGKVVSTGLESVLASVVHTCAGDLLAIEEFSAKAGIQYYNLTFYPDPNNPPSSGTFLPPGYTQKWSKVPKAENTISFEFDRMARSPGVSTFDNSCNYKYKMKAETYFRMFKFKAKRDGKTIYLPPVIRVKPKKAYDSGWMKLCQYDPA